MGVLLPRHIDNSLNVYLFLEPEPWLGKSKELSNQGMKENRACRIIFLSKNNKKADRLCMEFS